MRELVESGKAKLIDGTFPKIDEAKVRTRFHSTEHADPIDKLTAALEKQTELLTQLISSKA